MTDFEVHFYLNGHKMDALFRIEATDMPSARQKVNREIWESNADWFEWYDEASRTSATIRKENVTGYEIVEIIAPV